ncbi:MAG: hypothetical protein PHE79_04680 [Eubacteriales bacterium]|nr:hypothetical protein [Eubacteriales bacterium]
MDNDEVEKIGIEVIFEKTGILAADLKNKMLTNNFSIEDLYLFKHRLNLNNERLCKLFEI